MDELILAAGLVLILEGLLYGLFPGPLKRFVVRLLNLPEEQLRFFGLAAALCGILLVWMVRRG